MKKSAIIGASLFALPFVTFAQATTGSGPNLDYFTQLVRSLGGLLNNVIPIIIALTVIVFFFGLFKYVSANGDKAKADGQKIIMAGLLALFIEVSIWGIIRFAQQTVNIKSNGELQGSTYLQPPAIQQPSH